MFYMDTILVNPFFCDTYHLQDKDVRLQAGDWTHALDTTSLASYPLLYDATLNGIGNLAK